MTYHGSFHLGALRSAYASGVAVRDVVREAFRRIADFSRRDPAVWIDLLPEDIVAKQAADLQRRRDAGENPPLFGVPFAVKDNFDVAGRATTAACPGFAYIPGTTAHAVQRCIDAGAVLIGKTNLDQFATGLVGTRSPYGACRNVFDARYICGGSSSGSAVAVAAGLVSFAFGTDTAGSGRVPAALNNIVGYKPTRGLISTRGMVPACRSLDCASVFALTCGDAAAVAGICAGFDAADPFSRAPAELSALDRVRARPDGSFRFGVPRGEQLKFFGDAAAAASWERMLRQLEGVGGQPVAIDFAPFAEAARLLYEGPWLAERYAGVGAFIDKNPDAILPVTRQIIQRGRGVTAAELFRGTYRLRELIRRTEATWESIDVLSLPQIGRAYTIAEIEADPFGPNLNLGYYTNFVNLMDLAAVTVPAGFRDDGLPAGLSLVGQTGSDGWLLSLADRIHRAAGTPLGATGVALDDAAPLQFCIAPNGPRVALAVVGAHLSDQPLNHQLTQRGAHLVRTCRTAPKYRLFALPGTTPPKPGLIRCSQGAAGHRIEVEVWELDAEGFGTFVAAIPPPLGIGTLELDDGTLVKGFLCESSALECATDISQFGGWRAFLASSS